jgi:hypothetical protein
MIRQPSLPLRGLAAVPLFGLLLARAVAGDVAGVVSDPGSTSFLSGASVIVVETSRAVSTDSEGRFRLTGLPAGNYTLDVQYLGYEGKQVQVTVPDGEVKTDIARCRSRPDGCAGGGGYREGRSRSPAEARRRTSFPPTPSTSEPNVAEAVAGQGSASRAWSTGGRYVSIRGIDRISIR